MNSYPLRRLIVLAILLLIYAGFSLASSRASAWEVDWYPPGYSGNYVLEPICNSSGNESVDLLADQVLKVDCAMKEATDNDNFGVTYIGFYK